MNHKAILVPGRNAWEMPQVGESGLIVDAKDYYTAFYRQALEAKDYILLSGWQFDRDVELLREGDEALAAPAGGELRLLKFLNYLCENRPNLKVYVLAWDFHIVFSLEREWMQKIYFHWGTNPRMHFRFDDCHPSGGSHHQKFVVIDGKHAFLGGIDLCQSRWDDRQHLATNPARTHKGTPQKPYHDVQAYFTGSALNETLKKLFCDRWVRSGAEAVTFEVPPPQPEPDGWNPRGALPLPAPQVAISRTDPQPGDGQAICEIRQLLVDMIAAAQRLIYLETQYFSSREICEALQARMRAASEPKLEIVLVTNQDAEALKEELAVGLRQSENIRHIRKVAEETGHHFGAYYTLAEGTAPNDDGAPAEISTYIHSKLTIVDDQLLSMGSANLTNRSMGLDTELNVSWETPEAGDARLERAIRRVRVSLLTEHIGEAHAHVGSLARVPGLVAYLDQVGGRLKRVPPPSQSEAEVLAIVDPQALPFDPECPSDDVEAAQQRSLFRVGITELWHRMTDSKDQEAKED